MLNDRLQAYADESKLTSSISAALSLLISSPQLPQNPYASLIPHLRQMEIRASLLKPPPVESSWLSRLKSGEGYGPYNVVRRRTARVLSPPGDGNGDGDGDGDGDPCAFVSLPLMPGFNGSAYGLPHVMKAVDAVGLAGAANVVQELHDKVLYPNSNKSADKGLGSNDGEYRERMYNSVLTPTVFHGQAFSSGELTSVFQQVRKEMELNLLFPLPPKLIHANVLRLTRSSIRSV